jgi:hypothetical protein
LISHAAIQPCDNPTDKDPDCFTQWSIGEKSIAPMVRELGYTQAPLIGVGKVLPGVWLIDEDISSVYAEIGQQSGKSVDSTVQLSALLQYRRWGYEGPEVEAAKQVIPEIQGDTQDTLLTKADDQEVRDFVSALLLTVEQSRLKERFQASPLLTSHSLRELTIIDDLIKGLSPESAVPLWEGQLDILDALDDTSASPKLRQGLVSRRSLYEDLERINESLSAGVNNVWEDEPGNTASTSQ